MEFILYTLIDITETGQHRGSNRKEVGQQANYNTVIQTIGLRANLIPKKITQLHGVTTKFNFGSTYKKTQNYWEFLFEVDYGLTSISELEQDFHMVPIITGLNETIKLNINVFDTYNIETKNIVFKKILE